uniref:Uncharacterized protein n=1 Tax=Phytophthora ramorum TaxID=164328 RepID=H3H1U9_PHYRM
MATPQDAAFAQGMFVALWPKVERCHEYVELLVAAQDQLQQTVDKLIAGEGQNFSSFSYAEQCSHSRVERLQKKLARIQDRLLTMKESRNRGGSSMTKFSAQEAAVFAAPLF